MIFRNHTKLQLPLSLSNRAKHNNWDQTIWLLPVINIKVNITSSILITIAMTNVVMAQVIPVRLTEEDFQLYYNGCCNATFWPLFHSMPDRWVAVVFDQRGHPIPSKIPVNAFGKVSVEGLWNVPIRRLNQRFPRCAEITKNPHQGCLWRGVLGGVQASLIIILSIHISNLQESKWKICWRNPEGIEGNGKGNPYFLSTVGSMGEICCQIDADFFLLLQGCHM